MAPTDTQVKLLGYFKKRGLTNSEALEILFVLRSSAQQKEMLDWLTATKSPSRPEIYSKIRKITGLCYK